MSNVRTDVPTSPNAFTKDLRANFAIIKAELESIQTWINSNKTTDSPQFSGTTSMVDAIVSGTLTPTILDLTANTPEFQDLSSQVTALSGTTINGVTLWRWGKLAFLNFMFTQNAGSAIGIKLPEIVAPSMFTGQFSLNMPCLYNNAGWASGAVQLAQIGGAGPVLVLNIIPSVAAASSFFEGEFWWITK